MGRRHRAGRFLILRGCTSAYIPLFVQEEAPETLPLDSGRALPCTRKGVPPLTLSRDSVGDTFKLCPRVNAEISPLRRRPEGFAVALWTASRPQLSLLSFIETNLVGVPFVPKQQYKSINRSMHCEGVKGATADFVCFHCPLVAPAGAKSPATIKTNQH